MLLKEKTKRSLETMRLHERINYGYKIVITMMLTSGLISMIVIGILFANMFNYVKKVNVADTAVKICRIDVNAAARNIREMALNDDFKILFDIEKEIKEAIKSSYARHRGCF